MSNALMDQLLQYRTEVERAAQHYYGSEQQTGIDNRTKRFVLEACLPHVGGQQILELGFVDGLWTDRLIEAGFSVDVVEGAAKHAEHAKDKYRENSSVRVFHSLFQEFAPDRQYDTIIAGDMLRYLPAPEQFLRLAQAWLKPHGKLIATIPNSKSMHRRVGALMNMEATPAQANQRDREVGNLRSYDRYEFKALLQDAGYSVKHLHGCFLKPLSSAQMSDWSDELLNAFALLGDELEDYCWFIYAVAEIR